MKLDQRRVADLPAPNHTQARAIKACLFDPRITRICTDMDRHCGTAALRKRGMAVAYRSARFSLTSAGRIGHVVIGSMNFTKVCMALVRIEAGPDDVAVHVTANAASAQAIVRETSVLSGRSDALSGAALKRFL